MFLTALLAAHSSADTCISNPGAGPDICVDWDEPGEPVSPEDFTVDFTVEAFPDVEFKSESETWRVWSVDTDNPGNIGDIGDISVQKSQGGRLYKVRLRRADGTAGARDV